MTSSITRSSRTGRFLRFLSFLLQRFMTMPHDVALSVEVFANSVMRGGPRCRLQLPNGFNFSIAHVCAAMHDFRPGQASLRVT